MTCASGDCASDAGWVIVYGSLASGNVAEKYLCGRHAATWIMRESRGTRDRLYLCELIGSP